MCGTYRGTISVLFPEVVRGPKAVLSCDRCVQCSIISSAVALFGHKASPADELATAAPLCFPFLVSESLTTTLKASRQAALGYSGDENSFLLRVRNEGRPARLSSPLPGRNTRPRAIFFAVNWREVWLLPDFRPGVGHGFVDGLFDLVPTEKHYFRVTQWAGDSRGFIGRRGRGRRWSIINRPRWMRLPRPWHGFGSSPQCFSGTISAQLSESTK